MAITSVKGIKILDFYYIFFFLKEKVRVWKNKEDIDQKRVKEYEMQTRFLKVKIMSAVRKIQVCE